MCWTIFHESKKCDLIDINVPSGFTQSAVYISKDPTRKVMGKVGRQGSEEQSMRPLEIIRFVVNFSQEESITLEEPADGTVSIHDRDQIRLGRLQSFELRAGRSYEIFMEESLSHLLEYPYPTSCYPYLKYNQDAHKKENPPPHPLLSKPLSSSDCFYGCLANETLHRCGCWPPEIPFLNGVNYEKGNPRPYVDANIKLCDWVKMASGVPKDANTTRRELGMVKFYNCFSRQEEIVKPCRSKCRQECIRSRIKASVQEKEWPSKERIKYASDEEKIILRMYRNCCSVVSLRMVTNEITDYSYSAKYDPIEFVSYIAGIVGLYLGFTFIAIFDYVKAVVEFFLERNRNKKTRVNSSQMTSRRPTRVSQSISQEEVIPWYMNFDPTTGRKVVESLMNPVPVTHSYQYEQNRY